MEKSQRPLSDQNRKLIERNKNLTIEQKKNEKEMAEIKDELITMVCFNYFQKNFQLIFFLSFYLKLAFRILTFW